jgi:hypothetical protein
MCPQRSDVAFNYRLRLWINEILICKLREYGVTRDHYVQDRLLQFRKNKVPFFTRSFIKHGNYSIPCTSQIDNTKHSRTEYRPVRLAVFTAACKWKEAHFRVHNTTTLETLPS